MIHVMGYRDLAPGGWGSVFFDDVLPAAVATHDGGVPYWPGSPYGESADGEDAVRAINGVLDGDRHAWEVWHGMDFGAGGGEFASVGESRLFTAGTPRIGASSSASSGFTPRLSWPLSGDGFQKINFRCTAPALIITTKTIRRTNTIRCWRSSLDCRPPSSSTSTSP